MSSAKRLRYWFHWTFQVLLLGAGVFAFFNQNWINVALAALTIFLSFVPSLIERQLSIDFPSEFELLVGLFLLLSLYLGEIQQFYIRFFWWDLFLHTISGVLLGLFGLALVRTLNQYKVTLEMSPGFIALFATTFAVTLGVIWEIFEFAMDAFLGLNMQKSGLVDTMWDLIVALIGSIAVSLLGYLYLRRDPKWIEKLERVLIRVTSSK